MATRKWKTVNESIKRLKHQDILLQLDRLEKDCNKTAAEYVAASKERYMWKEHRI